MHGVGGGGGLWHGTHAAGALRELGLADHELVCDCDAVRRIAGGTAALAGMLLVSGPTLLSTGAGLQAAVAAANLVLPGSLHVERASLGWFKPVCIENVRFSQMVGLGKGGELAPTHATPAA